MPWKCTKGHTWKSLIVNRTAGRGCPKCAEYGFNPSKPSWIYLMQRPEEQQFGITNDIKKRIQHHASFGWHEIDTSGPHNGEEVFETEKKLKNWLKKEVGVIPHRTENWYTSKMEVNSLAELKEKSGIDTPLF